MLSSRYGLFVVAALRSIFLPSQNPSAVDRVETHILGSNKTGTMTKDVAYSVVTIFLEPAVLWQETDAHKIKKK